MTCKQPRQRGAERGSAFQKAVDHTNGAYARLGRAFVTRKAIPGKYVTWTTPRRRGLAVPLSPSLELLETGGSLPAAVFREGLIRKAPPYVFIPESRAEPDYGGVVAPQGRGIFYDAKTTQRDRLEFDNLHPHQITFLENMAACGGIAGFLVEFARHGAVFFVPIQMVTLVHTSSHRRSIPYHICATHLVPVQAGRGLILHDYLPAIERQEQWYGMDYAGLRNSLHDVTSRLMRKRSCQ